MQITLIYAEFNLDTVMKYYLPERVVKPSQIPAREAVSGLLATGRHSSRLHKGKPPGQPLFIPLPGNDLWGTRCN